MMAWGRANKQLFDPADFFVPPTVGKGTSEQCTCWIQNAHHRGLEMVAHSGYFPWKKSSDVVRWCIKFGLTYIDELLSHHGIQNLSSVMAQAQYIDAQNEEAAYQLAFRETIEKTKDVVNRYKAMGGTDGETMARLHINKCWQAIQKMPNEPDEQLMWKMRYVDEFRRLFGESIDPEESTDAAA